MTFPERLKQARAAASKTQRSIADAMGVTVQAVSQWEKGQAAIQADRIEKLAKVLGVDYLWLKDGFKDETISFSHPKSVTDFGNVPKHVIKLSDVHNLIIAADAQLKALSESQVERVIYVDEKRYINPLPIKIEGDRFSPTLEPGDIAIFDLGLEPRNGDVVVMLVSFSGALNYKRLKDHAETLRPAIAHYGPEGLDLSGPILIPVEGLKWQKSDQVTYLVLGPLVERRTFPRQP